MTLKGDDKQHDAYRKKKAAQYKEPRALTEDELAEAQAREIAEKRAAKAHVPLAAINRGDFQEGNREVSVEDLAYCMMNGIQIPSGAIAMR